MPSQSVGGIDALCSFVRWFLVSLFAERNKVAATQIILRSMSSTWLLKHICAEMSNDVEENNEWLETLLSGTSA
jgi:hypothetical protein